MTELAKNPAAYAAALLTHYSFDLGGYTAEQLISQWLRDYQASWVRSAVIEALYQGRYKAISVEQILVLWDRRGQPLYHFNHEFERIVCHNLPQNLTSKMELSSASALLLQIKDSHRFQPDRFDLDAPAQATIPADPKPSDSDADDPVSEAEATGSSSIHQLTPTPNLATQPDTIADVVQIHTPLEAPNTEAADTEQATETSKPSEGMSDFIQIALPAAPDDANSSTALPPEAQLEPLTATSNPLVDPALPKEKLAEDKKESGSVPRKKLPVQTFKPK